MSRYNRSSWVTLPHHQGHEINSEGQIRNGRTGKILSPSVNQSGVQYVALRNTTQGQYENKAVGVLVAEVFCEGQTSQNTTVLYLDGDHNNNRASNLMWAPRWHAMAYHREINNLNRVPARPIRDDLGNYYPDIPSAARATGSLPSAIDYAVRYNDQIKKSQDDYFSNDSIGFTHKVWPSGRVFFSAR